MGQTSPTSLSRGAPHVDTVSRGPLKGIIYKDAAEAKLIDRLADTNGVVDAAHYTGIVSFTEGENCGSILVSDKDWICVELAVAFDGGSIDNVCHPGDSPG